MLKKFLNIIIDFLFPIYCISCKKPKTHLCPDCLNKIIVRADGADLKLYKNWIFYLTEFKENSAISELIHRFKYDGATEIVKILGMLYLLSRHFGRDPNFTSGYSTCLTGKQTFLIPVPLHRRRFNFRGFNQSLLLAQELSKKWNFPIADILQRHRYTKPQVELNKKHRLTNVIDAFSLKNTAQYLDTKNTYILIDDVCTTGATLNECAKVLRKNGAERIFAIVVAKT